MQNIKNAFCGNLCVKNSVQNDQSLIWDNIFDIFEMIEVKTLKV